MSKNHENCITWRGKYTICSHTVITQHRYGHLVTATETIRFTWWRKYNIYPWASLSLTDYILSLKVDFYSHQLHVYVVQSVKSSSQI